MKKINQIYAGFVTGTGRVGTKFFGDKLGMIIDDCFSVHEPDVLARHEEDGYLKRIKDFGLYHMTIGRALGKTGIRNLSVRYIAGELSLEELMESIYQQRHKYYESLEKSLIVEAYSGWYGAVEAVRNLYKNYKIVVIIRDPRTWIASNFNKRAGRTARKVGMLRLNPEITNDTEYIDGWEGMDIFAQFCWYWQKTYEILFENINGDDNCKVVRFEDIFVNEDKLANLEELVKFVTNFTDKKFNYHIEDGIFSSKVNKSRKLVLPQWTQWDKDKAKTLQNICGHLMDKFNYGKEAQWQELIK